ncbi:MAG: peptide chain release factor N(5)-glutamine methyltransferase [Nitrospiraceae bacterium]|nr:peptide chain release factor N(5)-glutamine methyltransferase [Nitrospiraceae bacterium]
MKGPSDDAGQKKEPGNPGGGTLRARGALKLAIDTLKGLGVAGAADEARAIMREGLGVDMLRIYRDDPPLSQSQLRELKRILARRKKREPLQYILGFVWFYGLKIGVGKGALIPRPETEILVEEALGRTAGRDRIKILDLCTGSGAIALALARNLPGAEILATDVSSDALRWAEKNGRENAAQNVRFLKGDLFGPVQDAVFDIITANPPYIKDSMLQSLEPEVVCWEPGIALSGGPDGLDLARRIISGAPAHLVQGGLLLMEIAAGTDPDLLAGLARGAGLEMQALVRDLAGLERVFIAAKKD